MAENFAHIGTKIGTKIGVSIGARSGVTPSVTPQYREFTSMVSIVSPLVYEKTAGGTRQFRKRIASNILYYEIEITATGFDGSVGTDYLRFAQYEYSVVLYRHGEDGNSFKLQFNDGSWNTIFERQISGTATLFRDGIDDNGDYVIQEWVSSWTTIYKFDVA